MSVRLSSLVWDSGPTCRDQRFVLLAISEYAGDDGFAWPSISSLSARTLFSGRAVIAAIQKLAAGGWLSVSRRSDDGRGNCYQLNVGKLTPLADGQNVLLGANSSRELSSPNARKVKSTTEIGEIHDNPPHPLIGRTVKNRHSVLAANAARSGHTSQRTQTPNRTSSKPPKEKPADPRFGDFVEVLDAYHKRVSRGEKFVFTARDGKQLKAYLADHRDLTVERFAEYIAHREAPARVNHAEPPAAVLSKLDRYRFGPLDEYGKPIAAALQISRVNYSDPATLYSGPEYQTSRRPA